MAGVTIKGNTNMSNTHKTPYVYNNKSVKGGTVEMVIRLKKTENI